MMTKKLAVLVPIYKNEPSKTETDTLRRIEGKFPQTDKFFIAPRSLELSAYTEWNFQAVRFSDRFFKSESTYTRLLLQKKFYRTFLEYDYVIIIQTDVWLLKGEGAITEFMEQGWDYVGAPWPEGKKIYRFTFHGIGRISEQISRPQICYVGNGGLSLRKVQGFLSLLHEYRWYAAFWRRVGEDNFFAYFGEKKADFKVADINAAKCFALEEEAERELKEGNIPIGVHAWGKYCPNIAAWERANGKA